MSVVDPKEQSTLENQLFRTNFKYAPGGVPSDNANTVINILNQQTIGGGGGDGDFSTSSTLVDSSVPGGNIGGGFTPIIATPTPDIDYTVKLPANFSFSFENYRIITDSSGNQSANVDISIPATPDIDSFEVRIVKNG